MVFGPFSGEQHKKPPINENLVRLLLKLWEAVREEHQYTEANVISIIAAGFDLKSERLHHAMELQQKVVSVLRELEALEKGTHPEVDRIRGTGDPGDQH